MVLPARGRRARESPNGDAGAENHQSCEHCDPDLQAPERERLGRERCGLTEHAAALAVRAG